MSDLCPMLNERSIVSVSVTHVLPHNLRVASPLTTKPGSKTERWKAV